MPTIHIAPKPALFTHAADLINAARQRHLHQPQQPPHPFTIALSGGSTPREFYAHCVAQKSLAPDLLSTARFTVSDERCVPLDSPDSNFGNAQRHLLSPLNIPPAHQFPWPTHLPPVQAAAAYTNHLATPSGQPPYHICLLGIGPDTHTASLFPNSPLLTTTPRNTTGTSTTPPAVAFSSVQTPHGPRLTITPNALQQIPLIIVLCPGPDKTPALRLIHNAPLNIPTHPAQLLLSHPNTHWLTDTPF